MQRQKELSTESKFLGSREGKKKKKLTMCMATSFRRDVLLSIKSVICSNNFHRLFAVACWSFLTHRNKFRRASSRFTFSTMRSAILILHERTNARSDRYGCKSGLIWLHTRSNTRKGITGHTGLRIQDSCYYIE